MLTAKEDISSELPEFYKFLSRRLYKILEEIGASTGVRDLKVKTCTTEEILRSMCLYSQSEDEVQTCSIFKGKHQFGSFYIFGSSFEGTTTLGLKSDIDAVYVCESLPVVTHISDAQQYQHCFLLIKDSYTPAGYAKLQLVDHGMPLFRSLFDVCFDNSDIDAEDRIVSVLPAEEIHGSFEVLHGPAVTLEESEFASAKDSVFALRSRAWPDLAMEWITRYRHYNWPTQDQIITCIQLGCFLVKVGHSSSREKHLQWRISFSLQERLLVTNFNSAQLKCYILLKIIKKEMIHKPLGEKSLTSYHFKTCMFYMIENTPAEFWTEENLLICLHRCLQQMLVWAETGVCSNYFIPGENMFDGRVSGQMQVRICEILRVILSADFMFLLHIKTDMIGVRFQEALFYKTLTSRTPPAGNIICNRFDRQLYNLPKLLSFVRNTIFRECQNTSPEDFADELLRVKQRLQKTEKVNEHSVEKTVEAKSLLAPYIEISLMSALVVSAKHLSKSRNYMFNLLASQRWHALSLESDAFSSKLKQATLMCMSGFCRVSLEVLRALQNQLEHKISVCDCSVSRSVDMKYLREALYGIKIPPDAQVSHPYIVPCVPFLPAERELTPLALCYEMTRSIGSSPKDKEDWFDWAVVDGKILLYFLLYVNHRHHRMDAEADANMDTIGRLIQTDSLLCHRETALNLLGWIYMEKGLVLKAMECFKKSLTLQNTHNAAVWQLAFIICTRLKEAKAFRQV